MHLKPGQGVNATKMKEDKIHEYSNDSRKREKNSNKNNSNNNEGHSEDLFVCLFQFVLSGLVRISSY